MLSVRPMFVLVASLLSLVSVPILAQDAGGMEETTPLVSENADTFRTRMEAIFQEIFDNQNEATAVWIGFYDPLYQQDFYFALGNASAATTGIALPTVAATIEDHFDIGSISKTFSGTVVMMLAEEGVLSLNASVADLVPAFANEFSVYANYTLEQLLRMQPVVPDFEDDVDVLLEGDPSRRFTIPEVVAKAVARYPMDSFIYSSTNFLVIDHIVEELTKKSIMQQVQERIYTPLGMTNTVFPTMDSDGVRPEPAAIPYAGPGCVEEMHTRYGFPNVQLGDNINNISRAVVMAGSSGSMVSTLKDLMIWTKTGLGDDLLSDDMVALRHEYNTSLYGGFIEYGMAQFAYPDLPFDDFALLDGWFGHLGGTLGFSSAALKNDDVLDGAAWVSAKNTCGGGDTDLETDLMTAYTADLVTRRNITATAAVADEPNGDAATNEGEKEESSSTSSGSFLSRDKRLFVCLFGTGLGMISIFN